MPMMENLKAVNSFLRTLIAAAVVGGAAFAGYYGYTTYNAQEIAAKKHERAIQEAEKSLAEANGKLQEAQAEVANKVAELRLKDAEISKLNASIDKLETSLALVKVDHRVARFTAVDQSKDETSGEVSTLIKFVEVNDEGLPLDLPRQFRIKGDTIYIDAWLIKFDDNYIEQADLERGSALLLFKRIFGNGQSPDEGEPLDAPGAAPKAYVRDDRVPEFAKKIWEDFWSIANNPGKQKELGIRAQHGDAPSMRVEKGKSYKVVLRSTGETSIVVDDAPSAN
jgi:hypothetical protein